MALPQPTEVTAIDAVFQTLLKDIVGATYAAGTSFTITQQEVTKVQPLPSGILGTVRMVAR